MPYIEARRNGSGSITSYRIVVSTGYDDYGKQIRHRFLWTPPKPGMSEKQMEKEATAAAYKYEEQINNGFLIDQHETFSQYAQYVLDLKEKTGVCMKAKPKPAVCEPFALRPKVWNCSANGKRNSSA